MAKSKPIGVRFDLEKLELIKKEQNLKSPQAVVNYFMDNYGIATINLADYPKNVKVSITQKEPEKTAKNEPKEGTMAWYLKNS
jgi:hypothetical protein